MLPPGGIEELAHAYAPEERELFLVHAPIPSQVFAAPDGTSFVHVSWFWGRPSVQLRSLMSSGALVETLRRWDDMPPWPRRMHRAHRLADVDREMVRLATSRSDRSVVVGEGTPGQLWAAHREHVAAFEREHGGGPPEHLMIDQALWLSQAAYRHERRVAARARFLLFAVYLALVLSLAVTLQVAGRSLSSVETVAWLTVALVPLWLLEAPAMIWLRYLRWIRPSFRDTVVRQPAAF